MEILDKFYGPNHGAIVLLIAIPLAVSGAAYYVWLLVNKAHSKLCKKTRIRLPLIRDADEPYRRCSEDSYL
jgi:cell division protein FtsX